MKKSFRFVVVCAAGAFAPILPAATVLTTEDGDGANVYIESDNPDTNLGNEDRIRARDRTSSTISTRNMYMRFDINSLSFNLSETTSVTLSIYANAPDGIFPNNIVGLYGLPDGPDDNWEQGTGGTNTGSTGPITFNNAPLVIDTTNNESPLTSFEVPDANSTGDPARFNFGINYEWVFPSSDELVDFVKSDTNGLLTFIVQYQTDDVSSSISGATYANPNADAPTLTLVPEPSSVTLFLLAVAAGWAFLPRRRAVAR